HRDGRPLLASALRAEGDGGGGVPAGADAGVAAGGVERDGAGGAGHVLHGGLPGAALEGVGGPPGGGVAGVPVRGDVALGGAHAVRRGGRGWIGAGEGGATRLGDRARDAVY